MFSFQAPEGNPRYFREIPRKQNAFLAGVAAWDSDDFGVGEWLGGNSWNFRGSVVEAKRWEVGEEPRK